MGQSSWSTGQGITSGTGQARWTPKYSPSTYYGGYKPSSQPGDRANGTYKPPPFADVGKFDISPMSFYGTEYDRVPVPGEVNEMDELPDMLGSWAAGVAPEPIKGLAEFGGKAVGSLVGLTGNIFGEIPNPFAAPTASLFGFALKNERPDLWARYQEETPQKQHQNSMEYNDEWSRWAAMEMDMGPRLMRDIISPKGTIGGTIEGGLGMMTLAGRLLQRNIIGRDATFDRIMAAEPKDFAAYEIKQQYERGELKSEDDVVDEAIVVGLGYSNDLLVSSALSIATDPAVWATFGAASTERILGTSGNMLGRSFGSLFKGARVDDYAALAEEAFQAGYAATGKGVTPHSEVFRYAVDKGLYADEVAEAFKMSPYAARFYHIPGAARVARKISNVLDPFTLLGGEGKTMDELVGKHPGTYGAKSYASSQVTLGLQDGLKPLPWYSVESSLGRLLGDSSAAFGDDMGRAGSNTALHVGNLIAAERQARLFGVVDKSGTIMSRAARAVGVMSKQSLRRAVGDEMGRVRQAATVDEAVAYAVRRGADAGEAAKWAGKLSQDELAVVHYANFGHSIDRFLGAQRQAIARIAEVTKGKKTRGGKKFADPERISFAGEDTLTMKEASEILKAAEVEDYEAIIASVGRYSVLERQVSLNASQAEIATEVVRIVKGLRSSGVLPQVVDLDKVIVDDALLDFVKEYRPYRLIYKPKTLTHITKDAKTGATQDVHSWIDWVDDIAAPVQMDRVGASVRAAMRPVYFQTVKRDAGFRFRDIMKAEHGLTAGQADRAFAAIFEKANQAKTTARGLFPHEVAEAVASQGFRIGGWNQQFSERQVVDAMLRAWEGSAGTVGLTQKVSGKAKVLMHKATGANPLGVLAERIYPWMRYKLNPFYQIQEAFETPINMMARGYNILMMRTQLDEDTFRVMGALKSSSYAGDQDLANQMFLLQNMAADAMLNGKKRTGSRVDAFKRFIKPAEYKKYAEARQFQRRFAKDFGTDMYQQSPETYARMVAQYADQDGGEGGMVVSWMHDLLAQRNPDGLYSTAMPSATRPAQFAQRAVVSRPLVAYLNGEHSWDALRTKLLDPGNSDVTETSIREALRVAHADPDYVERSVALLTGTEPEDWYRGFRELGYSEQQIGNLSRVMDFFAEQQGITTPELIALTQAGAPVSYDALGKYKNATTFFQSLVDANEARGLKMLPLDDDLHVEMKRLIDVELQAIARHPGTVKKAKTYATGRRNVLTKGKGRQPAPMRVFHGPPSADGKPGGPVHVGGAQAETVEERASVQMDLAMRVMGMEQIQDMALWYDHIRQSILAMAGNDPKLGAKMLLRFSYSQLNTSPELGMRLILRLTEDLHTGRVDLAGLPAAFDKLAAKQYKSLYGLNAVRQLQSGVEPWELATSEGLAQKLMDFTDSVAGNRLRMVDNYLSVNEGGTGLGPVAGDVHMRRVLGFYDRKSTAYLRHLTGDQTLKLVDNVGYQGADGTIYIDWAHTTKSTQPTNDEYAYILEEVNQMAQEFTRQSFAGIDQWTPAMVQAVLWHRIRSASGDFEGTPLAAVYNNMWHVGTDFQPGIGAPSRLYPWASLTEEERGLMTHVTGRVVTDTASEAAGTRVVSQRVMRGGTRTAENGATTQPVYVADLVNSQQGVQNHLDAVAIAGGQGEVRAMRTTKVIDRARYQAPVEPGAKKPNPPSLSTKVKVGVDEVTGKGLYEDLLGRQHFASDIVLARGSTLEDVDEVMKILEDNGDGWLGDGLISIQNAEGDYVIRFVDQTSTTYNRHLKAQTDEALDALSETIRAAGYENRADRVVTHILTSRHPAGEDGVLKLSKKGKMGGDIEQAEAKWVGTMDDVPPEHAPRDVLHHYAKGEPGVAYDPTNVNSRDVMVIFRDDDGNPVGYVRMDSGDRSLRVGGAASPITPGQVETIHVFVKPEAKGKGIATRMYDWVQEEGWDIREASMKDLTAEGRAFAERYWAGKTVAREYEDYGAELIAAARGRGDSAFADALERHLPVARQRLETAIRKVSKRKVNEHRAGLALDDPGLDYSRAASPALGPDAARPAYYQRTGTTVRGATVVADDGRRLIGINRALARGDTDLHEVWHTLEPLLQPSGRASIIRAYNRVKGYPINKGIAGANVALTGETAEWFTQQMVMYFRTGEAPDVALEPVFEFYRKTLRGIRGGGGIMKPLPEGELADVGKAALGRHPEAHAVNYDLDQDNLMALAHERVQQATRFGERWTYFRPGRSAMERSLNHPYLGLYPLSYFYGQVMPQLIEFLVARPFGLKAPFGGLIPMNYIYRSVMLQQEHDPEFRNWMAQNEPGFRAMAALTPGLPWEVPVNLAPTFRRFLQAELENVQRISEGKEPKKIDWGKIGEDIAGRAFNPITQASQLSDVVTGSVQGLGALAAGVRGAALPEAPEGYNTEAQSFLQGDGELPTGESAPQYPSYRQPPSLDESLTGEDTVGILEQAASDLESLLSGGVYPGE